MTPPKVQILLSTWNGAHWLPELLASLQRQTFQDWQLLIRDDGSCDQTLRILLDWQSLYPEKVAGLQLADEHLGSTQSFSRLVESSSAPYLLFCDQDDIWLPQKLTWQMHVMQKLERRLGANTPLLVHSDLAVIDSECQIQALSFWEYRQLDIHQHKRDYLLTNVVTGCATLFNRAAASKAFPAPLQAIQHDRWLALVCAWFGHIHSLDYPLVLYRQHDHNELGAHASRFHRIAARLFAWSAQAEAFLQRYGAQLPADERERVAALAEVRKLKGWKKRQHLLRHQLFKPGLLANLGLMLLA